MGCYFPLKLPCIPEVPFLRHYRRIQSCQHLTLLLAVTSGLGLMIYDFVLAMTKSCFETSERLPGFRTYCLYEWIDLIFLLPCTLQLLSMLRNYDDEMRTRYKELLKQKQTTQQAYTDTVRETLDMWTRATDANFQLARGNFQEKLQDFNRFLQAVRNKLNDNPLTSNDAAVVTELRALIRVWFLVYGEASSIDPQNRPLRVEAHGELDHCSTVSSLVDTAQSLLSQCRSAVSVEHCIKFLQEDPQALHHLALNTPRPKVRSSLHDLEQAQQEDRGPRFCSWVGCCRQALSRPRPGCYCRCTDIGSENLLDASCCCGACWMYLLDWPHLRVLLALFAAILVVALKVTLPLISEKYTWNQGTFYAVMDASPIALYVMCLLVLLTKIEYINMVAAITLETEQVIALNDKVNELRVEVQNFSGQSVQLTDLWLYCTLPRLDLMKEIHFHLRDCHLEDIVPQMRLANSRLAQLELWCGGVLRCEEDPESARRRFSSHVDCIMRDSSFDRAGSAGRCGRLDVLMLRFDEMFSEEMGEASMTPLAGMSMLVSGMKRTPMMDSFCRSQASFAVVPYDSPSSTSSPADHQLDWMKTANQQAQQVGVRAKQHAQQVGQQAQQVGQQVTQQAQQVGELMRPHVEQLQTDFLRPAAAQLQGLYNFFSAPRQPNSPDTLSAPLASAPGLQQMQPPGEGMPESFVVGP